MSYKVIIKSEDHPLSVNHYSPRERRDADGAICKRGTNSEEYFVAANAEVTVLCVGPEDTVHVQPLPADAKGLHDWKAGNTLSGSVG